MYNRDRLDKMRISHDTLLEYGCELIERYPMMRQLIIDKYPYILIDKYQDTADIVIKIMSLIEQYAKQIKHDVFRIIIPLNKVAAEEVKEQKTLSEREQKIYNMICENLHLSVEQVMAELDISRATVFRDYARIKKVTGAMYDKKTSTWTL